MYNFWQFKDHYSGSKHNNNYDDYDNINDNDNNNNKPLWP